MAKTYRFETSFATREEKRVAMFNRRIASEKKRKEIKQLRAKTSIIRDLRDSKAVASAYRRRWYEDYDSFMADVRDGHPDHREVMVPTHEAWHYNNGWEMEMYIIDGYVEEFPRVSYRKKSQELEYVPIPDGCVCPWRTKSYINKKGEVVHFNLPSWGDNSDNRIAIKGWIQEFKTMYPEEYKKVMEFKFHHNLFAYWTCCGHVRLSIVGGLEHKKEVYNSNINAGLVLRWIGDFLLGELLYEMPKTKRPSGVLPVKGKTLEEIMKQYQDSFEILRIAQGLTTSLPTEQEMIHFSNYSGACLPGIKSFVRKMNCSVDALRMLASTEEGRDLLATMAGGYERSIVAYFNK